MIPQVHHTIHMTSNGRVTRIPEFIVSLCEIAYTHSQNPVIVLSRLWHHYTTGPNGIARNLTAQIEQVKRISVSNFVDAGTVSVWLIDR